MTYWQPTPARYQSALTYLRQQTSFEQHQSLRYKAKRGQNAQKGYADPLTQTDMDQIKAPAPQPSPRTDQFKITEPTLREQEALAMRMTMGSHSVDVSHEVMTETIATDFGTILSIYRGPQQANDLAPIVFFHGGAWVGGSPFVIQNFLKHLAQISQRTIINVDYVLAPEKKGTWAVEECYRVLVWLANQKMVAFGNRFIVGGDSAGGNLAAAVSYLDRKRETNYVLKQILFYPVVTLDPNQAFTLTSSLGKFEIRDPKIQEKIKKEMAPNAISEQMNFFKVIYANDEPIETPLFSPFMIEASLARKMPDTLVFTAQFDVLFPQGAAYAQKLAGMGVPTTHIHYLGQKHAFLDKYGIIPQAEDAMWEMASWLSPTDQVQEDE